jgi:hypothetical protein
MLYPDLFRALEEVRWNLADDELNRYRKSVAPA